MALMLTKHSASPRALLVSWPHASCKQEQGNALTYTQSTVTVCLYFMQCVLKATCSVDHNLEYMQVGSVEARHTRNYTGAHWVCNMICSSQVKLLNLTIVSILYEHITCLGLNLMSAIKLASSISQATLLYYMCANAKSCTVVLVGVQSCLLHQSVL